MEYGFYFLFLIELYSKRYLLVVFFLNLMLFKGKKILVLIKFGE